MTDRYVVPYFNGPEHGTKENPFSVKDSREFDALMRSHYDMSNSITWHLNDGEFSTVGTKEWDDTNVIAHNVGFRVGRNWKFTSETEASIVWDHSAIPDADVSEVPLWLFLSTEARFDQKVNHHTPEDVWNLLPNGQSVNNVNIDLRFNEAVDRWKTLGKNLRIGAGFLSGHKASFEHIKVINYGTLNCESFPLYIQGSVGRYDRNLIAQLDPSTYVFDFDVSEEECSHISDCSFEKYSEDSNDQVSLAFIAGGMGEKSPEEWVQHYRAYAYQRRNTGTATGVNKVQGFSLYQTLKGDTTANYTENCSVGYYGDWLSSKGVEIRDNAFLNCRFHGVQLQMSPVGPGCDQFSHENYTIGRNKITSDGPNVLLDTVGAPTASRYIRTIRVDANLTLENRGAENVIIMADGVPMDEIKGRKGCRPW